MQEGARSQEWLLKRMEDSFSNAIRLTPAKAVLADSPQEEIARLAEMYLERAKRGSRSCEREDADLPDDARGV